MGHWGLSDGEYEYDWEVRHAYAIPAYNPDEALMALLGSYGIQPTLNLRDNSVDFFSVALAAPRDYQMRRDIVVFGAVCVLALGGCQYQRQLREDIEQAAAAVSELSEQPFLTRVDRATAALPKRVAKRPSWLLEPVTAVYRDMPVVAAIRALLPPGKQLFFDASINADANADMGVSSPSSGASLLAHLDGIAAQLNWSWRLDAGDTLAWTAMPSRVFRIAIGAGKRSAALGRQGGGRDALGASGGGDQRARLEHVTEPWQELKDALGAHLGDYSFSLLPSVNSVLVTARRRTNCARWRP